MKTYKVVLNKETVIVAECSLSHAKNVKAIYGSKAEIIENIKGLSAMIAFIKTPTNEMYPAYGDSAIQKLYIASR
jgi:hypothetical protein